MTTSHALYFGRKMKKQLKPALHWTNRVLKVMKKSCRKNNKEVRKRSNAANQQQQDSTERNTISTPPPSSSPRKRRGTIAQDQEIKHLSPALLLFPSDEDLETPPVISHAIYSPPRLEQRSLNMNESEPSLCDHPSLSMSIPMLPSAIMDGQGSSRSSFRLKPRGFRWNPNILSHQLGRGPEQTLTSILNENNFRHSSPPTPPIPNVARRGITACAEAEPTTLCQTNLIQPVPRYGSATDGSTTTMADNDNTTFADNTTYMGNTALFNALAEEPCCVWFNTHWTSAFDVVPSNKETSDKK